MDKQTLQAKFKEIFQTDAEVCSFSPGRVNLIGEHTDYNGGHVFPCAISLGTYGAASKRADNLIKLYSANFADAGVISVDNTDLHFDKADGWSNYAKGVLLYLQQQTHAFASGLNIYVAGNIPNGSGLSSSASLELLIGVLASALFGVKVPRLDLVKIGMKTENDFIGVNSGIMDQFAVGMGKANHAIYLDTNTLQYKYLPLDLADATLVIMNTNHRRELSGSKYNERRSECEQAVRDLQTKLPDLKTLGELTVGQFDEYRYLIGEENCLRRATHAVSENARTQAATDALSHHDVARFGRLMNASHVSLEYDYQVTGPQLNAIVHAAWQQPGTIGARMTGAGFGGCALALVKTDALAAFETNVATAYHKATGLKAEFYEAKIADGTKLL